MGHAISRNGRQNKIEVNIIFILYLKPLAKLFMYPFRLDTVFLILMEILMITMEMITTNTNMMTTMIMTMEVDQEIISQMRRHQSLKRSCY